MDRELVLLKGVREDDEERKRESVGWDCIVSARAKGGSYGQACRFSKALVEL